MDGTVSSTATRSCVLSLSLPPRLSTDRLRSLGMTWEWHAEAMPLSEDCSCAMLWCHKMCCCHSVLVWSGKSVGPPFVLQHFFYGHGLAGLQAHGLEHDPERPIPYNPLGAVCQRLQQPGPQQHHNNMTRPQTPQWPLVAPARACTNGRIPSSALAPPPSRLPLPHLPTPPPLQPSLTAFLLHRKPSLTTPSTFHPCCKPGPRAALWTCSGALLVLAPTCLGCPSLPLTTARMMCPASAVGSREPPTCAASGNETAAPGQCSTECWEANRAETTQQPK